MEWVRQLQIEFTPLALLGGEQRCKISTVRSIALQFCLPIWISLARAMAKKWFDNWKTAFDNVLKSGANIDGNALVPPAKDDLEKGRTR